jgi:RNA polymerase sigma-70 factor (ECF subfamily)
MAAEPFREFLRRVRAGDEAAAAELVEKYVPLIRREVRMRLTDPALFRLVSVSDVCQSVLLSFFVRAAAGQYELDSPQDLRNLLLRMACNKAAGQARRVRSRPADARRVESDNLERLDLVLEAASPAQAVTSRDLVREVLRRLPAEERRLAELRGQGLTWPQVSAEVGGTSEARRKQLARALDLVLEQLGLQEDVWSE